MEVETVAEAEVTAVVAEVVALKVDVAAKVEAEELEVKVEAEAVADLLILMAKEVENLSSVSVKEHNINRELKTLR